MNRTRSGFGLAVGVAIALSGCASKSEEQRRRLMLETEAEADQREADRLAGYMMRLGYGRWVAACAYEKGRMGRPKAEVAADCTVDFPAAVARAAQ